MNKHINSSIRLTVAITAYYNSNPQKFYNMILSLFAKQTNNLWKINKENMLNPKKENQDLYDKIMDLVSIKPEDIKNVITKLNEKVELLIILDNNPEFNYKLEKLINIIKLFQPYVNEFCEIRYIIPTANVRVACARNIVFTEAKGEYIAFCDDDDIRINVNELLKLMDEHYGIDYISHYSICSLYNNPILNKLPFVCNLSCWSGLIKKEFIIKNKLYLVPFLAAEDVVWRSDIDYIINYSNGSISQSNLCGYVYMEASQTSTNNILNNSRYLSTININSLPIFNKSNLDYYKLIDLILSQQLIVGFKITDYRIFAMTTCATYWKGYNIIKQWLIRNKNKLDKNSYDCKMTELSSKLVPETTDNLFQLLTPEDKQLCIDNIPKYFTLPDLLSIAKQIDNNMAYEICDQLWNCTLNYKLYENKININEFVFRFMCLQFLRENKYENIIKDKISIVKSMYNLYLEEDKNTGVHDFYMYAHDLISRRFNISDIFNLYNNKSITKENIESFVETKSVYKYAYDNYKIDHDIKTTVINKYDTHYKGIINVFIFYILACNNLINPVPEINIEHKFNYTGHKYEIYSL